MNITYSGILVTTTCWCGIYHAMPRQLYDEAHKLGRATYCPLGHSGVYKNSAIELARQARIRAEARAARAEDRAEVAERRCRAAVGQVTKMKNRVKKGVCPFCKRTFANVTAHMETQHKDGQP